MRQALEVVGFLFGVAVVVSAILSAVRTIVLPRAAQGRASQLAQISVRAGFRLWARRYSTFEDRDRLMAMLAPVSLLALVFMWLLMIVAAYTLMFFCLTGRSWKASIELSGSSVFTLGTTSDPRLGPSVVTYSEAALGLLIVALTITYFPSIYNAFARRETGVSLLEVRAGIPPRATTMLIRFHRIEDRRRMELKELWRQWEVWFTEIEESHTTFPILAFFRSPQRQRSWITAAGTLLDGAALWQACIEHPVDPDVQLCIRAGFLALRRIADGFRIDYPPDPQPGDPITISRDEWEEALDEMAAAGVPLLSDRDQAWRDWSGWRVNYDTVLLRLARLIEAPPAPWVSDRSPLGSRSGRRRLRKAP